MARYSKYGAFDTPIATDGDTGFLRMNNRLRPDQLKPTDVAYSSNGRMDLDGAWQTRKGVEQFGPVLTANTNTLTIPFYLFGAKSSSDVSAFWFGAMSGAFARITLQGGSNLQVGETITISGLTQDIGNVTWDLNGLAIVASVSGSTFGINATIPMGASGDFEWSGGSVTTTYPMPITAISRSSDTVSVTTQYKHSIPTGSVINIDGVTFATVDPNGNRQITSTGNTTFTFTITGATGSESYTGGNVLAGKISATQVTGVYGSCLFSNPNTANDNYIILATNLNAQAVKLSDGTATTIAYPTGVTISSTVSLLQAFDKVFIFRNGEQALEWNGSFSGTPAFTKVIGGDYANPVYFDTSNNTTVADGVATVTETAHGLSVGDRVWVVNQGSGHLIIGGDGYVVATVPNANTFTFFTQTEDDATHRAVFAKRQSDGLGLMHMPGPAWAVHHQRRLWVPYAYTPGGTSGSPTYTDRNILDEVVASDILDSDTYDKIEAQYRITGGTADSVVGVEPFAEDNLLVFMRHSIHLIKGVSGSLLDTSVNLITKEVGCVSRRSIIQIGNQVLFLSDNGVYAAAFGDLYNLRGAGVPLSEPINPLISRINRNYAQNSVAAYYNNRYYIAVPLDSSIKNNTILVYNLLNQGWESIDTINLPAWDIQDLIVGDTGGFSNLYAVGSSGSIHVIDSRNDGFDRLSLYAGVTATTNPIASYVKTRQYTMGTIDRKKFSSYEIHVESSASEASNANISFECENLDSEETLGSIYQLLDNSNLAVGEDASLRGRIGNKRGYGAQLTLTPTVGRPKLRAVNLNAALTNLGVTQAT